MTKLIDQRQRDLINDDLQRNFLVEAGAGSGKTRSLVTRMTNLILSGSFRIHQIVAITFTRKAADELKERFQASLEKAASETSDPLLSERVEHALEQFDQCFLGTVHAFCSKLLRERPVEAGLDFDFTELDDQEDEQLLDQAWERYLVNSRVKEPEKLAEFQGLGIDITELRSAMKTVKEYEDVHWFTSSVEKPNVDPIFNELFSFVEYAKFSLPKVKPQKGYDQLQDKLMKAIRHLQYFDMNQNRTKIALIKLFDSKPKVTQNRWESKEEAKDVLEKALAFHENAKAFIQSWQEYCHSKIVPFLRPALAEYKQIKAERSLLNFQDMLLLTAQLLREQPETRHYFQEKYRCLLVDEFQDTDPVQAEMMLLLTGEQLHENDWTKQAPKPGSLFVVGDPKQSIYRFRRADIDIYQKVKKIISETGGETLDLVMNFRTTSRITERINPVFEQAFPPEEDTYQAAYRPLTAHKLAEKDEELKGVYQLTVPDGKKDEVVETEAHQIASYIRHCVDEGKAKPSDFMILTRYNEGVSHYTKVLQNYHIPVMTSGDYTLKGEQWMLSLAHLLMYIANPSSSFYFSAVLRGPFFGVSDDALFRYKNDGGEFQAFSKIPETLNENDRKMILPAFQKIREYLRWAKVLLPSTVIESIAEDLGFHASHVMEETNRREAVHYYQMVSKIRDFENKGLTMFGDCARHFYQLVTDAYHEEVLLPEDHQAVRVMNVHKSKGLEAPIVFLAHPKKWTDAGKHVDKHIQRSEEESLGYFTFSKPAGLFHKEVLAQPVGWEDKKAEETTYLKAEEDRLLYVAATRAEEMLIISAVDSGKNKTNPWSPLLEGVESLGEVFVPESVRQVNTQSQSSPISFHEYELFEKERDEWIESRSMETYRLITPSNKEEETDVITLERVSGGGKEWGTFIHVLFEELIKSPQTINEKIPFLMLQNNISEDRQEEARLVLNSFIQTKTYQRIVNSDQVLTEVPFTFKAEKGAPFHPGNFEGYVYVNGIIDLVLKEGEEWVIIDFKTDHLKNDEEIQKLREYYEKQLDVYVKSWEFFTGGRVKEATLHFTNHPEL